MSQVIFTCVLPVVLGKQQLLRQRLVAMDYKGSSSESDPLSFQDVDSLHYASLFMYDDPCDGWHLVFENNIDGEVDAFFAQFVEQAQTNNKVEQVLSVFNCCVGFENGDINELASFLKKTIHMPAAAYSGCIGRTRKQILFEAQIHQVASSVLDEIPPNSDASTAAKAVHTALSSDARYNALKHIPPETPDGKNLLNAQFQVGRPENFDQLTSRLGLLRKIGAWLKQAGLVESLKAVGALVIFLLLGFWNWLRKESSAEVDTWQPEQEHLRSQRAFEDFGPSNHMVSIVYTHHDFSRRWAKWAAFKLLSFAAKYGYTEGVLGSIPTIHFAHWASLNNHRRLLFVSNYDGSWESYLDDFTQKAQRGLTLAWAHGKGIPRTQFMLSGGAAHGPEFIDWARRSMVPTLVWFNAYPHLSIRNINRNSALRQAIAQDHEQNNAGNWLELVQ